VNKQIGRWYFSLNPTMDKSFHGPGAAQGLSFSPNVKVSYDFTKKVTGGVEYYAGYGDLTGFDSLHDQQQQIFPAIDLNLSPKWGIGCLQDLFRPSEQGMLFREVALRWYRSWFFRTSGAFWGLVRSVAA
jgi:hypothetical protein